MLPAHEFQLSIVDERLTSEAPNSEIALLRPPNEEITGPHRERRDRHRRVLAPLDTNPAATIASNESIASRVEWLVPLRGVYRWTAVGAMRTAFAGGCHVLQRAKRVEGAEISEDTDTCARWSASSTCFANQVRDAVQRLSLDSSPTLTFNQGIRA